MEFQRDVNHYNQLSKIECMKRLILLGWNSVSNPAPYCPRGLSQFDVSNLMRSVLYWRCLLDAQAIFDKGYPNIDHTKPHGYYMCLLSLNGLQLQALLNKELSGPMTNKNYMQFMLADPLLALEPPEAVAFPIQDGIIDEGQEEEE